MHGLSASSDWKGRASSLPLETTSSLSVVHAQIMPAQRTDDSRAIYQSESQGTEVGSSAAFRREPKICCEVGQVQDMTRSSHLGSAHRSDVRSLVESFVAHGSASPRPQVGRRNDTLR